MSEFYEVARAKCVRIGWEKDETGAEKFIGRFEFCAPPKWPLRCAWGDFLCDISLHTEEK